MIGFVLGLLVLAVVMVLDSQIHPHHVVDQNRQPDTVSYADGSTHYVAIYETRTLLGRDRHHQIYSGRDPSLSYGHFVRVDFTGTDNLEFAAVDWLPEGVRLRFDSGHELFIPAEKFVGGR
ncbi:hypothetical protein ACFC06_12100 [Nocardia sp. NPDC056064]|uniref:hypothetical protein n=1 Tax=Nocardia sp. NPDC056064 TaxID=3345701 RepID=UPI0035E19385